MAHDRLRVPTLVLLLVGLVLWNDAAQWTHVGPVPLGAFLPLILFFPAELRPVMRPVGGGWALRVGMAAYLVLGAVALWRGWHTPDLALTQFQMTLGALWLVVFARLLPLADLGRFFYWLVLLGTPVVAGRMISHRLQHLVHTAGELRLLHSESDVAAPSIFLLILLVYADQFRRRWLAVLLMAANAVVLVATFKRSGMIGLLVVAALYTWLRGRSKLPPAVRALAVIGMVLAVILLFAVTTSPDLSAYVADRLNMRTSSSALWRFSAWGDAWALCQSSSLLWGAGYGRQLISVLVDFSQHVLLHNAPLALLAHMGVPGVVAFAVVFGVSLRRAWQMQASADLVVQNAGLLAILASAYLLVFMTFNPALDTVNTGAFIWLFLAIPFAAEQAPVPSRQTLRLDALVLTAVAAALAWVAVPKTLHNHTLYSQEAGGKLPWATWGEEELESRLHRGDPVTLVPGGVADGRVAKLTWTWLFPEYVSQGHESVAHTVFRVTYNQPPSHPLAYNLLDKAGDAMPGVTTSQSGRVHEVRVGELATVPRYFIVSDLQPTDRGIVLESVTIRAQ